MKSVLLSLNVYLFFHTMTLQFYDWTKKYNFVRPKTIRFLILVFFISGTMKATITAAVGELIFLKT